MLVPEGAVEITYPCFRDSGPAPFIPEKWVRDWISTPSPCAGHGGSTGQHYQGDGAGGRRAQGASERGRGHEIDRRRLPTRLCRSVSGSGCVSVGGDPRVPARHHTGRAVARDPGVHVGPAGRDLVAGHEPRCQHREGRRVRRPGAANRRGAATCRPCLALLRQPPQSSGSSRTAPAPSP